jgi:hypothetical protein
MAARQVARSGSKIDKESCSVSRDQTRSTSMILFLKEGIPSLDKGVRVREKSTDAFSYQFAGRALE